MKRDATKLFMNNCDPGNKYQQWVFGEFNVEKAKKNGILIDFQVQQ